jgi:hypothetical protein
MKNILKMLTTKVRASFLITLIPVLWGCNNGDDPVPMQPGCKITSEEATTSGGQGGGGVNYTYTRSSRYAYDEAGNKKSQSLSVVYNYNDGTSMRRTTTYNYEYDANSFLTRALIQSSDTYQDGSTSNSSNDNTYEYENGRLKIANLKTIDNQGIVTDNKMVYEYDQQGRITRFTNANTNAYSQFEYIGAHAYKITRVSATGSISSPLLEFDAQGLVTKSIVTDEFGQTTERRYAYNNEGLVTRYETYDNGKASLATEVEYDNKSNPLKMATQAFKGHPDIPSTNPASKLLHNTARQRNFTGNAAGQWEIQNQTEYQYDYNAQDLPVKAVAKTTDKDGVELPTETTLLEYQDCP